MTDVWAPSYRPKRRVIFPRVRLARSGVGVGCGVGRGFGCGCGGRVGGWVGGGSGVGVGCGCGDWERDGRLSVAWRINRLSSE